MAAALSEVGIESRLWFETVAVCGDFLLAVVVRLVMCGAHVVTVRPLLPADPGGPSGPLEP